MAITKIQSGAIPSEAIDTTHIGDVGADKITGQVITSQISDGAIHTDKVADLAVTHAKLHTDMDLSGKTVTLPTIQHSLSIDDGSAVDNSWNTLAQFHPSVSDGAAEAGIRVQSYPSTTSVPARMTGIQSQSNIGVALPLLLNKDGGNVGIGTDSPSTELHVEGNIRAGSIYQEGAESSNSAFVMSQGVNTTRASVALWAKDHVSYPGQVHIVSHSANASADSGKIMFWDYNGSSWNANGAWDKDGNLGVGTTSPSTKLEVDGAVKVKAGASDTGGIRLHTNSGINASANVMSFHTGQVDGFKFNINSDGADGNGTVVSITPAGNIVQQADYSNSRAIPEVYELEPYTINVGGYSRSWVKLFQFSTGGQQECQFRMHFQGDHNYNHLFMCQGQVHQWSASTGNVNFYIIGQGGNLTGEFVFTSDHSCYWKPSGLWSDTGRFEVLSKTSGCTIMTDIANNLADGSAPSGTIYSFSGTGSTSGEINWGQ